VAAAHAKDLSAEPLSPAHVSLLNLAESGHNCMP
jgi:hypothetical protein